MKCDVIAAGIVNAAKGVSFTCSFLAKALDLLNEAAICCPHSDLGMPHRWEDQCKRRSAL